jgi:hypothetical protein
MTMVRSGNKQGTLDRAKFGNGVDGVAVINAPTTLARTMFYESITLQAGGSVNEAGFEVYARRFIWVQSGGAIHSDGANATTGSGAPTVANGEVDGRQAGGNGGGNGNGAVGANGNQGGAGGNGGAAAANLGGVGGLAGNPSTSPVRFRSPGASVVETGGGGGGGAGSGGGAQGGGGGQSGGECSLHAPAIRVDAGGRISADGGQGALGQAGNGGGGGGGGGGKVRLEHRTLVNNGTIRAQGGPAGAGIGTGVTGASGSNGIVEQIRI